MADPETLIRQLHQMELEIRNLQCINGNLEKKLQENELLMLQYEQHMLKQVILFFFI